MSRPKKQHGGRRDNSGRKPFNEVSFKRNRSFKMSERQSDALDRLGGAVWLRSMLDSYADRFEEETSLTAAAATEAGS